MAGLSQLLNPSWYSLSYDELSPDVRSLVDSGAFRWGESMTGGDDPKAYSGWQVADYSKIPTFADGTRFDNSNRDFNQHAGSWTAADSWDNIVDPSRVTNDPNFGRVTTTNNVYDNKGIGDFMEKVVIGTLLGGAGLAAAGAAGFAVPSWVTGTAGAAEGGAGAGLLSENILQGFGAGTPAGAGAVTTGGEILTGLQNAALGGAAGGAAGAVAGAPEPLSAADAYAVASGGQTPTPFTSSAGGFSLTDAAKTVKQAASLLGGGGDVGAMPGGGAGGGLLGGGGGMGGGASGDPYFMGLLRKYYGLA